MVEVRIATPSDCIDLGPRLRHSDVEEVRASSGKTPTDALLTSLKASKAAFAVTFKGRVEVIFGVGTHPLDPKVGVPWLLASPVLEKHAKTFLKTSRNYIDLLQSWYPILTNAVDERHVESQRWLEWCGFVRHKRFPSYGSARIPFIQYVRYDNV